MDCRDKALYRKDEQPVDTCEVYRNQFHTWRNKEKQKINSQPSHKLGNQERKGWMRRMEFLLLGRGVINYLSLTSCPSFLSDSVFRSPRGSTSTPASCETEEHEKVRLTIETTMGRETAGFLRRKMTSRVWGWERE